MRNINKDFSDFFKFCYESDLQTVNEYVSKIKIKLKIKSQV